MSRGAASARAIERDEPSAPLALAYASRLLAERRRPGRTLLFAVPAPVAPVERLLDAAGHEPTVLFAPPDAAHVAGFGVAHAVRLEGTERFDALRRESAAIFERLDVVRTDFPGPAARVSSGASRSPSGRPVASSVASATDSSSSRA